MSVAFVFRVQEGSPLCASNNVWNTRLCSFPNMPFNGDILLHVASPISTIQRFLDIMLLAL